MKRELLIFGAYGALGAGAAKTLIEGNYTKIYLFDAHISTQPFTGENIDNVAIGDLTLEESVRNAFSVLKPSKDKYLFLFSTVGGFRGGKTLEYTELEDWDKMFDMNLKTNFMIAKYFSGLVRESAGGSICFTSASSALNKSPKKGAYDASKSGLISLVKTLALEGADIKLSANSIAPYIIDTPNNRKWMSGSDFDKWIKPEEIGRIVDLIFSNFNLMTGNIFELANRFETKHD